MTYIYELCDELGDTVGYYDNAESLIADFFVDWNENVEFYKEIGSEFDVEGYTIYRYLLNQKCIYEWCTIYPNGQIGKFRNARGIIQE